MILCHGTTRHGTTRHETHRGSDAIDIFCRQILRILTKTILRRRTILLPSLSSSSWNYSHVLSSLQAYLSPRLSYVFLIGFQLFFWFYNFYYYYSHSYPLSLCIAKGFGLNLRILTMILFFTMARTTLNMLSHIPYLKPFLFLGHNIPIHSFLGYCTLFHSFGHTIMQIVYQMNFRANGIEQSFRQKSLLKLLFHGRFSQYSEDVQSNTILYGDEITGFILFVIIILMAGTALFRGFSSSWYALFSYTHSLSLFWLLFTFFHVPLLYPYFLSIALLIVCDRLYDYFFLTIHSSLSFSRPCQNGVTFLSIPYSHVSLSLSHSVGSYYRIQIPAISSYEWHPFSFAGSKTSHHLSFFIASVGDWTQQLYEIVSDPSLRNQTKVKIQGPFYAPAKDSLNDPTSVILLVATGIGITPFFSVIATKVTDEYVHESDRELYQHLFEERGGGGLLDSSVLTQIENSKKFKSFHQLEQLLLGGAEESRNTEVQTLHLIWTIRDAMELIFYLDYVYHLVKHQKQLSKHVVKVDVYLTGLGKRTDPEYMIAQTFFLLSVSDKLNSDLTIHFGRPNMKKHITSLHPHEIYYCGGEGFKENIREICLEQKIPLISESFDSTDSNLLRILSESYSSLFQWTNRFSHQRQSFQNERSKRREREDTMASAYSYAKNQSSILHNPLESILE